MSSSDIFNKIVMHVTLMFSFTLAFFIFGFDHTKWNGIDEAEDDTWWKKMFNRFYFTTITYSTIGYGDISPKSKFLRFLTICFTFVMVIELLHFFS